MLLLKVPLLTDNDKVRHFDASYEMSVRDISSYILLRTSHIILSSFPYARDSDPRTALAAGRSALPPVPYLLRRPAGADRPISPSCRDLQRPMHCRSPPVRYAQPARAAPEQAAPAARREGDSAGGDGRGGT